MPRPERNAFRGSPKGVVPTEKVAPTTTNTQQTGLRGSGVVAAPPRFGCSIRARGQCFTQEGRGALGQPHGSITCHLSWPNSETHCLVPLLSIDNNTPWLDITTHSKSTSSHIIPKWRHTAACTGKHVVAHRPEAPLINNDSQKAQCTRAD